MLYQNNCQHHIRWEEVNLKQKKIVSPPLHKPHNLKVNSASIASFEKDFFDDNLQEDEDFVL